MHLLRLLHLLTGEHANPKTWKVRIVDGRKLWVCSCGAVRR